MLAVSGHPLPRLGKLQRIDVSTRCNIGRQERRYQLGAGIVLLVHATFLAPRRAYPGALGAIGGNFLGQGRHVLPRPRLGKHRLVVRGHSVCNHQHHQIRFIRCKQILDRRSGRVTALDHNFTVTLFFGSTIDFFGNQPIAGTGTARANRVHICALLGQVGVQRLHQMVSQAHVAFP